VLKVLCGCAISIVVVLPVAHEESLDVPSLLLQEQCCDGGIDAAGQTDDDAGGRHRGILRGRGRKAETRVKLRCPSGFAAGQTGSASTDVAVARFSVPTVARGLRVPPR